MVQCTDDIGELVFAFLASMKFSNAIPIQQESKRLMSDGKCTNQHPQLAAELSGNGQVPEKIGSATTWKCNALLKKHGQRFVSNSSI